MTQDDIIRFWGKAQKTDQCWLWTGATKTEINLNYGQFYFKGKRLAAHRLAWELTFGRIPSSLCVLHSCDNPICVNPTHLFLGTREDNVADRHKKARDSRGARHSSACIKKKSNVKLLDSDILEIRRLCASRGLTHKEIADQFGIHKSTVSKIHLRTAWAYVGIEL